MVKAENEINARDKLRLSFTDEQLKTEFKVFVDQINNTNKYIEQSDKYIDEQLAKNRQCAITKSELIIPPTYEEFLKDYEICVEAVFELDQDITPLDETILINYF